MVCGRCWTRGQAVATRELTPVGWPSHRWEVRLQHGNGRRRRRVRRRPVHPLEAGGHGMRHAAATWTTRFRSDPYLAIQCQQEGYSHRIWLFFCYIPASRRMYLRLVGPDLGGGDFPLKRRQQPLRFRQGQTQNGDTTEVAGPIDPHDVLSQPVALCANPHHPQNPGYAPNLPAAEGRNNAFLAPAPPTLRQSP